MAVSPAHLRPERPLIGLPACLHLRENEQFHTVGNHYIRAVIEGAGGLPWILPALGTLRPSLAENDPLLRAIVARLDGLLLTGSPSNIAPYHYAGPVSAPGTLHDPARDAMTLPLIRAALAAGVPLLGICRGLQELNVALGGSLHQNVPALPGALDHRAADDLPDAQAYAPAHPVTFTAGGWLADWAGDSGANVNSLHAQGIDRLAPGLVVEAVAPDGLVEAVRVAAPAVPFALAVQWHPEWHCRDNQLSAALFAAFGAAAQTYHDNKRNQGRNRS